MNEQNNSINAKKRAKKNLLIAIAIICALIVLLLIASIIIDSIQEKNDITEIDYDFYPADYNEDIFNDQEYTQLINGGFIEYTDSTTNLTIGINRETAKEHGDTVEFIVEMIYDIIYGDHISYNKNFSDAYYKSNSPLNTFTMQKIYDVKITYISEESESNYTKYLYCLEYKIYENNGTFRRDIGEGSKKQYVTISNANGELLIDSISTVKTAAK
ncbi:MAG: hypothetical protein J6U86_04875 [Clostridia bacterium]|nr:hypothetical protein [Clostridia bacterium]